MYILSESHEEFAHTGQRGRKSFETKYTYFSCTIIPIKIQETKYIQNIDLFRDTQKVHNHIGDAKGLAPDSMTTQASFLHEKSLKLSS